MSAHDALTNSFYDLKAGAFDSVHKMHRNAPKMHQFYSFHIAWVVCEVGGFGFGGDNGVYWVQTGQIYGFAVLDSSIVRFVSLLTL